MKQTRQEGNLSFKIAFEGKLPQQLPVKAYVFDSTGKLVQSSDVSDGALKLPFGASQLKGYRIFIAPVSPNASKDTVPTIEQMVNTRAYEASVKSGRALKDVLAIPQNNIIYWWWRQCHVTGTVSKGINMQGIWQYLPVCNARVHICEIDYWFIWYLDISVIERIRWEWWQLVKPHIPFPFKVPPNVNPPQPGPGPDPGPLAKVNLPLGELANKANILAQSRAGMKAAPQQIFAMSKSLGTISRGPSIVNDSPISILRTPPVIVSNPRIEQMMSSGNLHDVRQALVSNIEWFRPYFCYWWPWFRLYFYTSEELAVVETDDLGNFSTDIWYQVFGDHPDIYVWVEYLIDGVWTAVYEPPIPCNTYWNYVCGTPININLYDPRVPACDHLGHLQGQFVEVVRVGSGAFMEHISQANNNIIVQGRTFNTIGCTDFNLATDDNRRPFGGTLGLKVLFGDDTLYNAGATHYRWSYHQIANSTNDHGHSAVADTSLVNILYSDTNWQVLGSDVSILYRERYTDSHGDLQETVKSFSLLDTAVNGVAIKIPRENITDMITPAPGTTIQYADQDWMSGFLNTVGLADGLYELKLELLSITSNNPNVFELPATAWKVPTHDDSNQTENAPAIFNYSSTANPPTAGKITGFKFIARVDNNAVVAAIDNIIVDGTSASTACGFVQYNNINTSTALIGLVASHPNDFATFSFSITKGNGNPTVNTSASGMTIGDTSGYIAVAENVTDAHGNLLPDVQHYSKTITNLNDLLQGCDKAAFADVLYVDSLATNGSNSDPLYAASAVAAFALEPAPPAPPII